MHAHSAELSPPEVALEHYTSQNYQIWSYHLVMLIGARDQRLKTCEYLI